jgi:subtilisin family serine protease
MGNIMSRPSVAALFGTIILIVIGWTFPLAVKAELLAQHSSNPSAELFDNTIIVQYKESSLQTQNPALRKSKMNDIAIGMLAQLNVTAIRTLPVSGIQQFSLGPGQPLHSVFLALKNHPQVQHVNYNYRLQGLQSPNAAPPNDPRWTAGQLWGLSKIKMNEAWQVTHDGKNIRVAVIDSGIDYLHTDINPNVWKNSAGSYGRETCGAGSSIPMDTNGHGTMVAGIIGAKGNNSYGVAGINWDIQLLAVRSLCGFDPILGIPTGSLADAEEGIEYATDIKADIIVTSWRIVPHVERKDISTLEDQIRKTNCQGPLDNPLAIPVPCKPALFVAAAGNGLFGEPLNSDLNSGKVYPANFPVDNIIPVAATDENDNLWSESHFGVNSVPIAAPGVNIDSTTLRTFGDGFTGLDGTSMAAPHVAGCAALLQAQCLKCGGSLLAIPSLKARILNSATQITTGLQNYIQLGRRLNCGQALKLAPGCPSPNPPRNLTVR